MIGRREVLAAGAAGMALTLAPRAEACSIVAQRNTPFSDRECRRSLQQWVDLLNRGPEMSLEAIAERVDDVSVELSSEMVDAVVSDSVGSENERRYTWYKEFRLSGGRLDTRPIRIDEINLVRQLKSRATYQFTLRRYSYHPADPEGCNGLFTHDEYWGTDRVAYLATFWNNRLDAVRPFPEWYLEERA